MSADTPPLRRIPQPTGGLRRASPPPRAGARTTAPPAAAPAQAATTRLNKRMSELGLASRREADEWIAHGWVRVDGQTAVMGMQVAPGARIEVLPEARGHQAQQVTVLVHKPVGIVSGQAEDGYQPAVALVQPGNRWAEDRTRIDFHPRQRHGLVPAGRLDIDSTGLLVLTQDGRVARHLIGEDSTIEKEYLVRVAWTGGTTGRPQAFGRHLPELQDNTPVRQDVQSVFPAERLERLRHGLVLDGHALKPAKVSWQNPEQLRFVLKEGRKRQIRRMCELVGLQVVGLKRVRIGSVVLGKLPVGQWRYLGPFEQF